MAFLEWLQNLGFSQWVNASSSIWAYPMFLFLHTVGMSVVAGGNAVIDLALLGLWPRTPVKPLERLYPFLIGGFVLNAFTGVSMFMKDATTAGTNMDFWIKMAFVLVGFYLLLRMRTKIFRDPRLDQGPVWSGAKALAWASLFCWFAAIVSGRLIAYVGPVAGI